VAPWLHETYSYFVLGMLRLQISCQRLGPAREGVRPHESRTGVQERHTAFATDRTRPSRAAPARRRLSSPGGRRQAAKQP